MRTQISTAEATRQAREAGAIPLGGRLEKAARKAGERLLWKTEVAGKEYGAFGPIVEDVR